MRNLTVLAGILAVCGAGIAAGIVFVYWRDGHEGMAGAGGTQADAPDQLRVWSYSFDEEEAEEVGQPDATVDLQGSYTCTGENAGGQSYRGLVIISRQNETYFLRWHVGRGELHRGFGVRQGDVLSVCFVTRSSVGVVSYRIQRVDGRVRLVGRWATLGMDTTYKEVLTQRTRGEVLSESI